MSKLGISSAPFPPREFLHLGRNSFIMPCNIWIYKGSDTADQSGIQMKPFPSGSGGQQDLQLHFQTTWGFTCLLAVKINTGLNPNAGSCKSSRSCGNSNSRSECSGCRSHHRPTPPPPGPSSTTHSSCLSNPAAAIALSHWAKKNFCI